MPASTLAMSTLLTVFGLLAALRVPGPLSPRTASYRIEATLDEAQHTIAGDQTLTWRNDASGPATRLAFHLYMNAFKNDASAYFRETTERPHQKRWGYLEVRDTRVRRAGGPWEPALLVVPPVGDQTLATLDLPKPIAPGETLEVEMHFVTHLPEIVARTGYDKGFYAVAQWFPKIAVFRCDPSCGFVADAHHANSEFFADFGTYDVSLEVPSALVVGATGVRVEERIMGARRLLRYHAEDIHDFAFAADARFIAHELDVTDDPSLPPVHVVLLGEPALAGNVARHLMTLRVGLVELGRRLGAYPYGQLTVVQVPPGAEEAGGMEYPTLFFTDDERFPAQVLIPELVTAHELAHQWLQGMLASDEVNAAWIDEGLTELATSWVLAALRPPIALAWDLWGHRASYTDAERTRMLGVVDDPIDQPAYVFLDAHAYAENTYRKTSLLFQTIAARIGSSAFDDAMQTYARNHRFKHPSTRDVRGMFPGLTPVLQHLLDDGLSRPGIIDYEVASVKTAPIHQPEGWLDRDGVPTEVREPLATGMHHSEITVARRGDLVVPVTVRARFADGTELDRAVPPEVDARRWQRVGLESTSALVEAQLHPTDDTPLDVYRWNDGLRVKQDVGPRARIIVSTELVFALLLSWIAR